MGPLSPLTLDQCMSFNIFAASYRACTLIRLYHPLTGPYRDCSTGSAPSSIQMELSPADMGESGGVNGVDLVGRSGARNSQEFRERFLDELTDYPYWRSCDFSTHYKCIDEQDVGGVRHSTYSCTVCQRNCTLRVQAYAQMVEADKNPPRRHHPKGRVPSHTQKDTPFTTQPDENDIHTHNGRYKLTGAPYLRSSPFKLDGKIWTDASVVRSVPNTHRGCRYAPY